MDHLGVGRALGIGIDGCEIIGFLDTGAGVERNGVEQFLCRGRNRIAGAGVTRTTAGRVSVLFNNHISNVEDLLRCRASREGAALRTLCFSLEGKGLGIKVLKRIAT